MRSAEAVQGFRLQEIQRAAVLGRGGRCMECGEQYKNVSFILRVPRLTTNISVRTVASVTWTKREEILPLLQPRLLAHRCPAGEFVLHELAERFGRRALHHHAGLDQPLAHRRLDDHFVDRLVELGDRRRAACRAGRTSRTRWSRRSRAARRIRSRPARSAPPGSGPCR